MWKSFKAIWRQLVCPVRNILSFWNFAEKPPKKRGAIPLTHGCSVFSLSPTPHALALFHFRLRFRDLRLAPYGIWSLFWPARNFLLWCGKFWISPITLSLDFKPRPSKKWGIRMRGDPLALQIKCHAKAQKASSDIFRLPFPSLKILLSPLYSISKTIMGSSVEPSLRSCSLAGEKLWRRLGRFDLGIKTHGWRPDCQG
jgi:hypothetical protein